MDTFLNALRIAKIVFDVLAVALNALIRVLEQSQSARAAAAAA